MNIYKTIKQFYTTHEHHFLGIAFIVGFIIDNLTLTRVDRLLDNVVLGTYLSTAFVTIILWNFYTGRYEKNNQANKFMLALPAITQFCFGALFSGFFVFYSRSGFLFGHLPFLLFLFALFLGNEKFRRHYERLAFQIAVFFIASFSYSIFIIPVIQKTIGAWTFIEGGILSLTLSFILIYFVILSSRVQFLESKKSIYASITIIYILFNLLYFTNAIPPLPLALKDIGVYHDISRTDDGYITRGEYPPRWQLFETNKIFHKSSNESVFVLSSVFAPTELNTKIIHEWFYFEESARTWVSTGRVSFPIIGGRNNGYRGYSKKDNATPGKWRVDVMTQRDEIIGRIKFQIVETTTPPELQTKNQ